MTYKVVHLTSVHPPYDTRIFHKECVTLAAAGYEVTLIVSGAERTVERGVRFLSAAPPSGRRQRMVRTANEIVTLGLREDADLYHLHDPELLLWSFRLRQRGKPFIFDMHENMPGSLRTKPWIPALVRRPVSMIFSHLERWLLRETPVVFAEHSYVRAYPWIRRSVVVLNLPDASKLKLIAPVEKFSKFSVGYMGGISEARGSIAMLDAIKLLQQGGAAVEFHCVGESKNETHSIFLQQKIDVDQINGVTLYGRLPLEDGLNIMARCHVGLAVLKPIPNYVESYPTKMFEYMALGLPVIVSDFPLYREIIDKYRCGVCVDPDNPSQIANALLCLVRNPDEADAMGRRGQLAVHGEMNWITEGQKLVDFYRSILSNSP